MIGRIRRARQACCAASVLLLIGTLVGNTATACFGNEPPPKVHEADVCVYGGTSGGVAAAVAAARMGKRVMVVEPGKHLGGMTASGLNAVDIGNPRSVGGISREYWQRLAATYGRKLPLDSRKRVGTGGPFAFEPSKAEKQYDAMAREAGVAIHFGKFIAAVRKQDARIVELISDDGTRFRAKMFIDATYEGDLMAAAGVSFTLIRESNAKYGETLNGIQFHRRYVPKVEWGVPGRNGRRSDGKGIWDRDLPIDPYVVEGDPKSGLLPLVDSGSLGQIGEASPGVQAYGYRLCLTNDPSNRVAITRPDDYDPKLYEIVRRFIRACVAAGDDMDLRWFSKHDPLVGGKYDFNTATFGGNLPGTGLAWAAADRRGRQKLARRHESYQRGLLYFLATDPVVPEKVRKQAGTFGLCKDEFTDNGGWPYHIYIRESRRMVSDLVMTEHHCRGRKVAADSVGLASYGIDLHEIRRIVHDGMVIREGKLGGRVRGPYPIGYRAIVPKQSECENLLVTFALSASHVGFGSIRMEPVFMILGQSAATAAAIAIDDEVPVQAVDYKKLQKRLIADGQVLAWPPDR